MEGEPSGGKGPQLFKLNQIEKILYTTVQVSNANVLMPKETSLLLSWNFNPVLQELLVSDQPEPVADPLSPRQEPSPRSQSGSAIALNISNLQIFGSQSNESQSANSLINFNPLVMKSYYNLRHFQFFYSDEKITQSATFIDKECPSQIIGTNYGRIFMVPLF